MSDEESMFRPIVPMATVEGLEVAVGISSDEPDEIQVRIFGGPEGWTTLARFTMVDRQSERQAKLVGQIVVDALEAAHLAWFDDETAHPASR